jgi:hypothetical protein
MYKKAEEMNRRALEGKEKVLGVEHPSGKYEVAEEMHRRALEGKEKVLGGAPYHTDQRRRSGKGASRPGEVWGSRGDEPTSAGQERKSEFKSENTAPRVSRWRKKHVRSFNWGNAVSSNTRNPSQDLQFSPHSYHSLQISSTVALLSSGVSNTAELTMEMASHPPSIF